MTIKRRFDKQARIIQILLRRGKASFAPVFFFEKNNLSHQLSIDTKGRREYTFITIGNYRR